MGRAIGIAEVSDCRESGAAPGVCAQLRAPGSAMNTRDGWVPDPSDKHALIRGEYRIGVHDQYSGRSISSGIRRITLMRGAEVVAQIRGLGLLDEKGQAEAIRKLKLMAR